MTKSPGAGVDHDSDLPFGKTKVLGQFGVIDLVHYLDFKKMIS